MTKSISTQIMLYMSAQNELSAKATENIRSIQSCCELDDICTYIMLDTIVSPNPDDLAARKTFHYRLPPGATPRMFQTERQEMPRDKAVTRPEIFQLILESALRHFRSVAPLGPPRQKILIFWGHGGGMVMLDESQRNTVQQSRANLKEFADMLVRKAETSRALSFDIVAFDSCYMCMIETLNQFRHGCSYVLCSSTVVDDDGFPYETIFHALKSEGKSLDPATAVARIAALYNEHYLSIFPDGDRFLFVARMDRIEACAAALNALGQALVALLKDPGVAGQVRKGITEALIGAGVEAGYVYVLSFLRHLEYALGRYIGAGGMASIKPAAGALRKAVHAAFDGNLGDSVSQPISPLIWAPLELDEFTRNEATYRALDSSAGGSGGWASLWRLFHGPAPATRPMAPDHGKSQLGFPTAD